MFRTLRFRLTLWHAMVFGGVALGVFGFAYVTVSNQLLASISEDLQDTAREFTDLYRTGSIKSLRDEISREALSHEDNSFFTRVIDASGRVVVQSVPRMWTRPLPEPEHGKRTEQWFDVVVNKKGDTAKLMAAPTRDHGWIQVGLSLHEHQVRLQKIRRGFGWALLVTVLAGIMTGWRQVSRALAGVDQVRRAAIDIGDGAIDRRLELGGHGQELVEMADAFNVMLDKIQRLLGEMRDVSDNIAHDLRTPITRIRGMAEAGLLARAGPESEHREMMAATIEECDRLTAMINTMLEIAQTDSGVMQPDRRKIDLAKLVREACELFMPVAEDAGIKMQLELPEVPLTMMADEARLQRMIANLLDNAIKFTERGGQVAVNARKKGYQIILTVADTGIGISERDMPHIFDRFYRSDRSRSSPGNGLGLAYARSLARAHGGDIRIESRPERGTKVVVMLPEGNRRFLTS